MTERDRLIVWHAERRVGRLWRDGLDRIGFVYDPTWREQGFGIGRTLPLRAEPFEPAIGSAHAWFANLLPEGAARERIVRQLGIADDDFALLRAIGGDCAGALSLLGEGQVPAEGFSADALDDRQLEQMIRQRGQGIGLGAAGDGEPAPRLSLAGAQAKCPVLIREGGFSLPQGSTASSHILKFELPEWRNVPVFEVFLNRLAASVGLPVPETRLSESNGQRFLVVARYDRTPDKSGKASWTRLHQEDFCQLEGVRPTRKYEADGGPGFSQCAAHVRARSELPAIDLRNLLRWQIFNWLAGNSDGHAKNLALVQVEPNADRWRLAPFYDLVCTRAWPQLDRRLAMSVGGEADPGRISSSHWDLLARDAGMRPVFVRREIAALANAIDEQLPAVRMTLQSENGDLPMLQQPEKVIRTQLRLARSIGP